MQILKTYKLYIGGAFPRTESGRYYKATNSKGDWIANICLSSRKDFRNAVVAARKAFDAWHSRAAFNRSQIVYRMAEMLDGRKQQFLEELMLQGASKKEAELEIQLTIDRIVYYCGWCDKYQQVFSSVNPVSSAHFNFSVTEAMGVVAIIADEKTSLLGLVSMILPVVCGGNTCVVLASESKPLCAITFAEILATSDLPGGVINILTGKSSELHTHFASHMDVNAIVYGKAHKEEQKAIAALASINVKRSFDWNRDWTKAQNQSPYFILDTQEIKTTWHPIEQIGTSGVKY
ncbi:MAG: aldehyde dehydrogenase family protein [Chitinophagaceae bacterium]